MCQPLTSTATINVFALNAGIKRIARKLVIDCDGSNQESKTWTDIRHLCGSRVYKSIYMYIFNLSTFVFYMIPVIMDFAETEAGTFMSKN
jgi:hypothetical protein